MAGLIALIVSSVVAWLTHVLIGAQVSFGTDFAVGTVVGGAAYVATFYWIKKLRRGF